MKDKLFVFFLILLFVTAGIPAVAQDAVRYPDWHDLTTNERADYNTNPAKILPDARAAFQKGEYGRTLMLCSMHWVVYGDADAGARERNDLDAKSKRCYDLSREMTDFISSAKNRAQQMLERNPDDSVALKVLAIPEPQALPEPPAPQEQAPAAAALAVAAAAAAAAPIVPSAPDAPAEKPATGTINGHEWVDLGLPSGLKWATCNVGADEPSDYGNYYAWGETSTKNTYDWAGYTFRVSGDNYDNVTFNKYNTQRNYGSVDNGTYLEVPDDAARANWGGSWRMPTDAEWMELRENCDWTWATLDGRKGYKVTSRTNGNSIFLPAAGERYGGSVGSAGSYGLYWSSSLNSDSPYCAWNVNFSTDKVNRSGSSRYDGLSVRPVTETEKE